MTEAEKENFKAPQTELEWEQVESKYFRGAWIKSRPINPSLFHPPLHPDPDEPRWTKVRAPWPETMNPEQAQQIQAALDTPYEFDGAKLWGRVADYEKGTLHSRMLGIGPGRVFGGTADLWRSHPIWHIRTIRDYLPGLWWGLGLFVIAYGIEQVVHYTKHKKKGHGTAAH